MKCIITIVLLLVLPPSHSCTQELNSNWGLPKSAFSEQELSQIAIAVCRAHFIRTALDHAHDAWCQDSAYISGSSLEERDASWRLVTLNDYRWFGYLGWPKFLIEAEELSHLNTWRDRFRVFRCTLAEVRFDSLRALLSHPRQLIVGVDFAGTFYYLSGFASDDFKQLVKSHVRDSFDVEVARQTALLYLAASGVDVPRDEVTFLEAKRSKSRIALRLQIVGHCEQVLTVAPRGVVFPASR